MAEVGPHDWYRPKLDALVAEAEAAGIARDVSVAVITDLINGPAFSQAPLTTEEGWNQDIGEPDYDVNVNNPASANVPIDGTLPNPMPFGPSRSLYR
jgi:hypothetical protein